VFHLEKGELLTKKFRDAVAALNRHDIEPYFAMMDTPGALRAGLSLY